MNRTRLSFSASTFLVLTTILFFYEIVAILGAYYIDLKGSGVDAAKFHELAIKWAENPKLSVNFGVQAYTQLLGFVYMLFGSSQFIGAQLSIVVILIAAYKMCSFLYSQGVRNMGWVVLIVFLWPSVLLRSATTMREPLLILATTYLVLSFAQYIKTEKQKHIFIAFMSGGLLFLFHKATGLITITILLTAFIYSTLFLRVSLQNQSIFFLSLIFFAASAFLFVQIFSDLREMRVLTGIIEGDVSGINKMLEAKYEKAKVFSRASYDAPLSFSSPMHFAVSLIVSFFHYMFEPFPNKIRSVLDIYGFIEVVLRSVLVLYICLSWKRLVPSQRFMFMAYIAISFVWSTGTTNYGTGSRHHIVGFWIIILLSTIIFYCRKMQFENNIKPSTTHG